MSIISLATPRREETIVAAADTVVALAGHLRATTDEPSRRLYAALLTEVVEGILAECTAIANESAARAGLPLSMTGVGR